jgi:hypothetical protein
VLDPRLPEGIVRTFRKAPPPPAKRRRGSGSSGAAVPVPAGWRGVDDDTA